MSYNKKFGGFVMFQNDEAMAGNHQNEEEDKKESINVNSSPIG